MALTFTVKLPEGASKEEGEELRKEIKAIAEVESAGVHETRSLTAAAAVVTVWLNLAKPAMEVVSKIIDVIRGKGLSGVEIQLAGGGSIKVDSASMEDIEKLLKAVREGQ